MASLRLSTSGRVLTTRSINLAITSSRTLFTRRTVRARNPALTALYATLATVSTGLFAVYYFDARSAIHRYFITPTLRHALDAETGHKVAVKVLRSGLGPRDTLPDDERLNFELWGEQLSNPIGVAAGFDKDGEAVDGLLDLGFSWVEIGSVTPRPQPGNPKPRVFHLPEDTAMINRYGFPSQGHASVLSRLRARIPAFFSSEESTSAALRPGALLAVNLGKNKSSPADSISDFVTGVRAFGPYADVLVVNVSSPNTPGLRGLQTRMALENLLAGVVDARDNLVRTNIAARKPKLVLKLAPDLSESELVEIAGVIKRSSIDGVIVSNTTVQRPPSLLSDARSEQGGLSGPPLKPLALSALRTLRTHLPARIPLIGCGGISTGSDALEYARAGASLVQVYTGFGYAGPGACRRIKDEVAEALAREGTTWGEVVRKAVGELAAPDVPDKVDSGGEVTVGTLVEEAKELTRLLDQFGESMDAAEVQNGLAAVASG